MLSTIYYISNIHYLPRDSCMHAFFKLHRFIFNYFLFHLYWFIWLLSYRLVLDMVEHFPPLPQQTLSRLMHLLPFANTCWCWPPTYLLTSGEAAACHHHGIKPIDRAESRSAKWFIFLHASVIQIYRRSCINRNSHLKLHIYIYICGCVCSYG